MCEVERVEEGVCEGEGGGGVCEVERVEEGVMEE